MCKPRVYKIKILSILTTVIIMILLILGVVTYDNYITVETNYIQNEQNINEQMKRYIYAIITENQEKTKTLLEGKTNNIQDKILQRYNSNENQLENDILYPNDDSKLTAILDEELGETWSNNNSYDNKPFVGTNKNIIWNRSLDSYSFSDKEYITWEDVICPNYNNELSKQSIDALLKGNMQKYDFIIWQNRSSNIILNNMDMKLLLDELEKNNYNIDELKGYELLVPVYITEDGDIFGVKDTDSLGRYNNNFKIIVVQELNMYDMLHPHDTNIESYQNELNLIHSNILENKREKVSMIIYICIFIISITIISGVVQNNIKE